MQKFLAALWLAKASDNLVTQEYVKHTVILTSPFPVMMAVQSGSTNIVLKVMVRRDSKFRQAQSETK